MSNTNYPKLDVFRAVAQAILTILAGILVPIGLALNDSLRDIDKRLDQFNERVVHIETWIGQGRRYTQEDAVRDVGVVLKVLERQGLTLDDHESRIRRLEVPR